MFWGFLLGSGLFIYWLEEIYMMLNCIWLSKMQPSVVQNFKYCIVLLHRGEGSGGSGKGIELLYWKNKYWKKLVLAAGEQKWSCIWTLHSPVWVMNCRSQKRGKYLSFLGTQHCPASTYTRLLSLKPTCLWPRVP